MPTHLVASFLAISALCLSCLGQAFTAQDLAFMGVAGSAAVTNVCDITHDLLSKWTFNEGGGTTVYDSTGGRNGTLSVAIGGTSLPQWNTPGFGSYNTNINFPNSYSWVNFGSSPYWNFYTNWHWTLTVWANHTNLVTQPGQYEPWNQIEGLVSIVSAMTSPLMGLQFKQTRENYSGCGNKQYWNLTLNGAHFLTSGGQTWDMCFLDNNTITNLTKYFWTIVRNNDFFTVYTNGALAGTNSVYSANRPTPVAASPIMWAGGDYLPGASRGWQGNIQEMRIYLASLTSTEITNLWNHLANNGPCP